jgi:hypothetical protein
MLRMQGSSYSGADSLTGDAHDDYGMDLLYSIPEFIVFIINISLL